MINDDGDIIRACGYLAIYMGNLEMELDEIYNLAQHYFPELAAHEHLSFTEKAKHLRKILLRAFKSAPAYLQKLNDERLADTNLKRCRKIAEARNEIFHSSIINKKGRDVITNRHKGSRIIKSSEIYGLANNTMSMNGAVFGLRFAVMRLANKQAKRKRD